MRMPILTWKSWSAAAWAIGCLPPTMAIGPAQGNAHSLMFMVRELSPPSAAGIALLLMC
jgi:hypothetical protein